jgi:tetratricopeptide (TPR) repeat protein
VTTRTYVAVPTAEIARSLAVQYLASGQQHQADGRIDDAIADYQRGLDAAAEDPSGCAVELIVELYAKLGNARMICGQLDAAAENYKAALRLSPQQTSCWCNLGNVLLQTGKPQDAIACYLQALHVTPAHWPSRTNLAQALLATRQYLIAKALLSELAEERPQDGRVQHELGKACFELNETDAALGHFEQAIAVNPMDADSFYWIGAIRQNLGDIDAAKAAYARAARIQPLIPRRAVKSPPDFRVLALYAPFAGNTPAEYLFKDAAYDVDTVSILGADQPDVAALGAVQVIVNLISDADQADTALPSAARLVERLDKPVVNDPDKIRRTTRDAVATLLPGIPACRIPRIVRINAGADISVAALEALLPFSCPLLARPAGTHGGDDFEKIASLAELSDLLARRRDSDNYVIEYIDTRSADGHFRKCRFIFVDGDVLPYHLAIGNDWKVHHVTTDMANQPWMQQEEATFLTNPGAVFSAAHYQALHTIRDRIGLDFFGIDCALDAAGDIVVFEANASMLVHDDNADFPYKDPAVRAIKAAFDAMLRKRAGRDRPASVPDAPPLSP